MALQTRLNETTDELDLLRKQQAALAVEHEAQSKALTLARSDRASSSPTTVLSQLTIAAQ